MPPEFPTQMPQTRKALRWIFIAAGVVFLIILGVFLAKLYEVSRIPLAPDGHVEEFKLPERSAAKLEEGERMIREASESAAGAVEEKKKLIRDQSAETQKIQEADFLPPPLQVQVEESLGELIVPGGVPELNPR